MSDVLPLIFARNAFYKRQYYLVLCAVILNIIVIGVLSWALAYIIRHPPQPLYFATDKVGRLIEDVPLDRPNMSTQDVINWTIEAIQSALSYDFVNYRGQLQNSQKYFTNYGWSNYMSGLRATNNLLALTQRKLVIVAQVVEQPKILTEGLLSGAYAWRIQMPVLATYMYPPFDDKSKFSNPLQVIVIVQRQSVLQSYQGLGILQIIGTMATLPQGGPPQITATPTS